jgi:dihydrodipicolinate synthase/N-acetylneuraminate lyase
MLAAPGPMTRQVEDKPEGAQQSRYPRTILATCCVPWRPDGEIDEPVFRDSIRHLIASGLRDLYVFGTAGEGYAVCERRFDEVVAIFAEECRAHSVPPMVGIISASLPTVIGRIERCLDRGIELFQLSLPSWGALTGHELELFFSETCGRFPPARFLHYNLRRAGRLVEPAEYATLAEHHPNFVATKNAGADLRTVAALLAQAGALRHFVTEAGWAYGSLMGECGFLVSIASINPALARTYFEAGLRRDAAALGEMARELALMTNALLETAGPGVQMDGAYDKVFNRLHDPRFSLRLLPPYVGIDEATFERFRALVAERFPRWLPSGNGA